MRRLLGATLLTGATILLVAGATDTLAQTKKAAKGTIELLESKDGKFRFNVRDADGKYLGGSAVGHETEKEARAAVEELKTVLATATFVRKKHDDKDDKKDEKDEKGKDAKVDK